MKLLIVLTSFILAVAAQALNEKSYIPPPRCKDDLAYNFCLPDCLEDGTKIEECFTSCETRNC
ncbi:uncharacterized protein H6S33_000975 [Morchella sextelata]|uniref:uncharacterized protein n=1 Tax=Morchella sextelata TaxID=1174677 RepID=UPI001D05627C|nr:uncharacterized protein H6S33_000975 [Morchella sextelata]KAH0615339.1 hypothetical protein H6S33_000975 [Morchella sextelata]